MTQTFNIPGDSVRGQGDASYLLGCAYLDNDDAETALLVNSFDSFIVLLEPSRLSFII